MRPGRRDPLSAADSPAMSRGRVRKHFRTPTADPPPQDFFNGLLAADVEGEPENPSSEGRRRVSMRSLRPLGWIVLGITGLAGQAHAHHPHDPIDWLCLSPSHADDETALVASVGSINLFLMSENAGHSWRNSRNGLRGKRIFGAAMASDWTTSGTAYAVTGGAGLQRTTDRGMTWHTVSVPRDLRFVQVLPKTADDSQQLFYGGHHLLFWSDDGGVTDRRVFESPRGSKILAVAVAPDFASSGIVMVGTDTGSVHWSTNRGASWSMTQLDGSIRDIEIAAEDTQGRLVWVATHGAGVYRSTDGGQSFRPSNSGLSDSDVNDLAVAPSFPACAEVFATTRDDGLFHSVDGGKNWNRTSLRVPKTFQTDNHYRLVRLPAAYPEDPRVYCATFEGLFVSDNRSRDWRKSHINPTRMGRKVAVSPDYGSDNTVFTSGYGMQLLVSYDQGKEWELRCTDIFALSGYALAVSPEFPRDQLIMLGVDRGLRRSTDGGLTWEQHELEPHTLRSKQSSYEVRHIVYSPQFRRDRTVFAVSKGGIFQSRNGGESWESSPPIAPFAARLALSPNFPEDPLMIVAGNAIHRSTRGGQQWESASYTGPVADIACAPDLRKTKEVFAIASGGEFLKSTDRGASWSIQNSAFQGHSPSGMLISPAFEKDGTIFVTTHGGGLYVSRNRGKKFTRVSAGRTPIDHGVSSAISPNFANDRTLFVGNFAGTWKSTDAGKSWELITHVELYDDGRQPWVRTGPRWTKAPVPHCLSRGVSVGRSQGQAITLPFTGSAVTLFGTRGPDHGLARIFVDNTFTAEVDCYAAELETQSVLFETDLDWGHHTLAIKVSGRKNPASSGTMIGIDGALVDYRGPDEVPVFASVTEPMKSPRSGFVSSLRWLIAPVLGLIVLQVLLTQGRKSA